MILDAKSLAPVDGERSGKSAWHGMKINLKVLSLLQNLPNCVRSARCDEFLLKAEGNFLKQLVSSTGFCQEKVALRSGTLPTQSA